MRRLFFLLFFIPSLLYGQVGSEIGIEGLKWNMTKLDAMAVMEKYVIKSQLDSDGDIRFAAFTGDSIPTIFVAMFNQRNELVKFAAMYGTRENNFNDVYFNIRRELVKANGPPTTVREAIAPPYSPEDTTTIRQAFATGNALLVIAWEVIKEDHKYLTVNESLRVLLMVESDKWMEEYNRRKILRST